jgi:hypothetical protein
MEAGDKYCENYPGVSAILRRIALYDYWVQPANGAEGHKWMKISSTFPFESS